MKKSKIITVVPTNAGAGAKFTTMVLAQSILINEPNAKVAVVDFDFRHPYLAAYLTPEDKYHGVDNLIEKIDANFLTRELFKENMINITGTNIDLLKGTQLGKNHGYITQNHVETIINFLRELYDYAIIAVNRVDDNEGTVFSLFKADDIVIVASQDYMGVVNIKKTIQMIEHYRSSKTQIKLFINKRDPRYDEISYEKERAEKDLKVIGTLPYDSTYVDNRYLKPTIGGMMNKKLGTNKGFEKLIRKFSEPLLTKEE